MAAVDVHGNALNLYDSSARITGDSPAAPWAVHLAGRDELYRLLCFDLDAKTDDGEARAHGDAQRISQLLTDAGMAPLICRSGPSGGRHVWVGLTEGVDAGTVATIARLTRLLCPSLDLSPLTNPVTGCVRPPGSPHRSGGVSELLTGDLTSLTEPSGTLEHVQRLLTALVAATEGHMQTTRDTLRAGPLPVDDDSRLYLPGRRTSLPVASQDALNADVDDAQDASAVLWRILLGAVGAHWRYRDIAQLVTTAPGLEHVRAARAPGGRAARTPAAQTKLLSHQWDRAVRYIASSERSAGLDPTFDTRAQAIAAHVRGVQERADASPGRWSHRGGPADRRVLDAISILALQGLTATVEADTRRLALLAGIGRETARTALLRLAEDGWLTHAAHATGPKGAKWTLNPAFHSESHPARSQVDSRRAAAGSTERSWLITTLTERLELATHDLFTGHRLAAGYAYAQLHTTDTTPPLGVSDAIALGAVARIPNVGLIPLGDEDLDTIATRLGVAGNLARRRDAYRLERELWEWWRSEHDWMTAPGKHRRRNISPGQYALPLGHTWDQHPPYPRHGRRGDHRTARAILAAA